MSARLQSGRKISDVKLQGRFLHYIDSGGKRQEVILPFGHGVTAEDYDFMLDPRTSPETTLIARAREAPAAVTYLSPPFKTIDKIRDPVDGTEVPLEFRAAVSDIDRFRARQVIEREHYLISPTRGMLLVCSFVQTEHQRALREVGKRKLRKLGAHVEPTVLYGELGSVVGVAVIDTLYHGNPKNGRAQFASEVLGNDDWSRSWNRREIVRRLRIAWVSRFAVDSVYHGLGIGTLLARHVETVARLYRAPAADFVEVITTEAKSVGFGNGNFLIKAGYTGLAQPMKSRPLLVLDPESGFRRPVPALKRYYYLDLRNGKTKR